MNSVDILCNAFHSSGFRKTSSLKTSGGADGGVMEDA